jgi:hypothetical protein
VPPAGALPLFTPEGERAWAGPAWNPVYPDSAAAEDDSAPGTVFTTESHGGDETQVTVVYDVTSLGPDGAEFVQRLRDGYDAFLDSWREEIVAAL